MVVIDVWGLIMQHTPIYITYSHILLTPYIITNVFATQTYFNMLLTTEITMRITQVIIPVGLYEADTTNERDMGHIGTIWLVQKYYYRHYILF